MAPDGRGRGRDTTSEGSAPVAWLARLRMRLAGWWRSFRHWRRTRPFWAGVITLVAAYELIAVPNLKLGGLTIQQGIAGIATWLMAALMALMALVMWFQPHLRAIAGVSTILFSLASFLTSNLGGFLLGMLLGLVGGAMAFAWDVTEPNAEATPDRGETIEVPAADEGHDERDLIPYDDDDQDRVGVRGPVSEQPTQEQPRVPSGERDHSLVGTSGEGGPSEGIAPR